MITAAMMTAQIVSDDTTALSANPKTGNNTIPIINHTRTAPRR